ncbi:cbb3-type cytochrome c oxidase subunit I [Thermoflavimicrobium dichotomicum]|uniref:cbb3-type cytochrome c oxidase subunit I n=1 Tax=Thermoflavimicrobium dichotomicum TaxID=46223 RepID=UPI001FE1FD1B|nr:cbb3-type cytochrome c oxidase subunit I [Thermoflavimicrobium dichotomicum]
MTLTRARPWVSAYKWPIYYFIAVVFWNLVGAGLFGFFINPPIALYYMQGLNTTSVHGHTALFGVYGMLGIGLMLFCLRGLTKKHIWKTKALAFSFWAINIGRLKHGQVWNTALGLHVRLNSCRRESFTTLYGSG